MQAVGYARWSSLEQGKGSSLERQTHQISTFVERRGWTLIGQVIDEGKSAYTGSNIHTGNLARLVKQIELGELDRNVVIVVEQLDRISRLPPSQVISWIQRITALGVSIATVNDGQIINGQMIDAEPMSFMTLVFNSFRAFQESKHKSERLGESWRIRRARVASEGIPATSVGPAWLEYDKASKRFLPVPDRAAVVEEIFQRTLAGEGKRAIAQSFNGRMLAPWGRGESRANGWHPSYIQKILSNPAVVGEYQPCTKGRGDSRRTPIGDPIPDYYPPVVSEKLWAQVQALRPARPGNDGLRGDINNLFSGLTRCQVCGYRMAFQLKNGDGFRIRAGKKVKQNRLSYFVCDNAARRLGCDHSTYYRYENLEGGILDAVLKAALGDSFFSNESRVAHLSEVQYRMARDVALFKARVGRLLELYTDTGDIEVREKWKAEKAALDLREKEVLATKVELARSLGQVTPREHLERVARVRSQISDPDDSVRQAARTLVAKSLRDVIEEISFGYGIVLAMRSYPEVLLFAPDGDVIASVARADPVTELTPEVRASLVDTLLRFHG